ncbi:MAG: metallophosphoesterase family protein [Atribacterota bacterium]|jgi:putative phosphoesterase|uniref:Phosphoesterase n=1 Tax=Candidatus Atribacter allofermentans TaxID=1852833 RepID=A0A1V5SK57_9BACT|nr:metallophosphoesterase family protein [Atribacterota bacterium]MDI9594993.1 metallophosphoesterase family protein [Atribacterota bacterium]OQA54946.1 MAG: phosphodiesterase [Candidatus Atribacteria bacterium ADurb.Bin276]
MKIAVLSDIHSNLPALKAVLRDIENLQPDKMICLGDLVGYAPFPNEVVSIIQSLNIPVIMGNYDQGVGNDLDDCGCAYRTDEERRLGVISIEWTKKMTTSENKRYLRNLLPRYQLTHGSYQLLFVHGSPRRINEYLFPDRPDENLVHTMMNESANVLICGHIHRPFSRKVQDVWFINDGSVGRPKDGDWRAGWVLLTILDNHALQIELRRCEYDLEILKTSYANSKLPTKYYLDLLPNKVL